MLSIGAVKSAGGAAGYYGKDDYYVSGEADKPGLEWGGEGAALAGLEGRAHATDFREVLEGDFVGFKDLEEAEIDAPQIQDPVDFDPDYQGFDPDAGYDDDRDYDTGYDPDYGPEPPPLDGPHDGGSHGSDPTPPEAAAKPEAKHRPGWDFTFSAPKTVSVAILAGGDAALDRAHNAANREAMSYLERHFSVTRVRENGAITQRVTGNLVYGSVVHGTSRAGDPDRHTHNVVANKTFDQETGKWRALETRSAYQYQQLLGMIYQGRMAQVGLEAGHNFKRGHTVGTFELAAWSKDEMRAFSQRREQIEGLIAAETAKTGAAPTPQRIDQLVLKGRPEKEHVDRAVLLQRWNETARENGIDVAGLVAEAAKRDRGADMTPTTEGVIKHDSFVERILARYFPAAAPKAIADPYADQKAPELRDDAARAAVSFAVRHLEQNSAVFDRHQVALQALRAGPVGLTIDRVEGQLQQLLDERHLHLADTKRLGGLTTTFGVRLEQSIIGKMQKGRDAAAPIMAKDAAKEAVVAMSLARKEETGHALTRGQMNSAYMALTSGDRYVAIQGKAGTGKTTLFKALGQLAEQHGHKIHGVVATNEAAGILKREAGIEAQTIESWLRGKERAIAAGGTALEQVRAAWTGRTLLLDEASLASNGTIARVQAVTETLGLRQVIMSGDKHQIGSVEAGSPFRLLQMARIRTSEMADIVRQHDKALKAAVEHASELKAHKTVKALAPTIHQVGKDKTPQDLVLKAMEVWGNARAQGDNPIIVVNTNAMRGLAAAFVRQELIKADKLGDILGAKEQRLYLVRMTAAEAVRTSSYQRDQVVVFNRAQKDLGIKRGDQPSIVGLDHKNNQLTLRTEKGRLVRFDLTGKEAARLPFTAYEAKQNEIRQREQLVWERTDKDRQFFVGQGFTVLDRDREGRTWTIRDAAGKVHQVSDREMQFTGYGHAVTADRRQGDTSRREIGIQSHNEGAATTMNRMYVQSSRATHQFDLITTDAKLLANKLSQQTGINPSALEELREPGRKGLDAAAGLDTPAAEGKGMAGEGATLGKSEGATPKPPGPDKDLTKTRDIQQDRSI